MATGLACTECGGDISLTPDAFARGRDRDVLECRDCGWWTQVDSDRAFALVGAA